MSLFGDERRTDEQWMGFSESEYSYLKRSNSVVAHNVRKLLETCLEMYPQTEQFDLIRRIRSKRGYNSATFELILHEWLRRQGFTLRPHPTLANGKTTHPDFLVTCPDGSQLYLEAACTFEDGGKDTGVEALKASALDVVYHAYHPDFLISVTTTGDPSTQPSGKKLKADVIRWLNTLDVEKIIQECSGNPDSYPEMTWSHESWKLEIRAIPLIDKEHNPSRGLHGISTSEAMWINSWEPIRDTIYKKVHHYGKLQLPFVVAVNIHGLGMDIDDEIQALFGQEQIALTQYETHVEHKVSRKPNGAWRTDFDHQFQRCSGVWLFDDFTPINFSHRRQTLYLNPKATLPVPTSFIRMPYACVECDEIKYMDGLSFQEVFALDDHWPE